MSATLDADAWIPWGGGKRPVDHDTKVEYRLRDGSIRTMPADTLDWKHTDSEFDIVAYRFK